MWCIIGCVLKEKHTGSKLWVFGAQCTKYTHIHTHTLSRVWHCDPTKNKEKVWTVSPPAEKPFPGVPVVGLSCDLRQKLEGSLKSCPPLFFCCCFSFYFLNISSREPEITRTVSPAVAVLFHVSLPFMLVRPPQTGSFVRHLGTRGGVCVRVCVHARLNTA